jgi:hypothetical protein
MIDIFDKVEIDLNNLTCHSGGAVGSDSIFESVGSEFGVKTRAYSYQTKYHNSPNKVEISEEDYLEGVEMIKIANKTLNRYGISKFMNLLARNWAQVKYSKQVFAIGSIIESGKKCSKGFYNKSKHQIVSGGTGYAVQMAIDNGREVFVYEQTKEKWHKWCYNSLVFKELNYIPKITYQDFAGVGTREIKESGILAIKNIFLKTFNKTSI